MKNKFVCLIALGLLAVGCNSNGTIDKDKAVSSGATCYHAVNDKDTINLQITINSKAVSGTLTYHIQGKDRNTGTVNGTMNGDTILANYTFMSEGTSSVREIAFIKQGENLVEGFGPIAETNGKVVFKNRQELVFNNANLLVKKACEK